MRSSLLLFLLLHGVAAPSALHAWREVSKPCHPDCTKIGNCSREFGRCECPFGRTGPACESDAVPACRPSGRPGSLPYIGTWLFKSCQCWKQLYQQDKARLEDKLFVIPATLHHGDTPCFELDGVPPEQQYSDIPNATQPGVKWYQPMAPDRPMTLRGGPPPETTIEGHMVTWLQLPLDKCPERCNERGACMQLTGRMHGPPPADPPECHCIRGHRGPSCAESVVEACLNKCGGRGECMGGFCKCQEGFWGLDCTRSKAFEPDPGNPAQTKNSSFDMTRLRIYRYELPWQAAFFQEPRVREVHTEYMDGTYGAWEQFFNQFSPDWESRTENPYEANLFYIPLLMFMRTDNTGLPQPYLTHAVHYLNTTHPDLWGRNQGKDHFVWLSNDQGACDVDPEPHYQNIIKLVHFGMHAQMPWRTHAIHAVSHTHHQTARRRRLAYSKQEYHCFLPEKDIVAPDNRHRPRDPWMAHVQDAYKEALEGKPRPYLLFFGGGIRPHDPHYSGGARLEFHKHVVLKNHSDVKFGGGHELYRQATFCLCPFGAGFGSRLGHAMMGACIPVILQDNVHQPLEDVLDYPSFSVRMRKADVPRMMDILRAITPAQIQTYRKHLHEVHAAFTWSVAHGGQAYNYTLKSLRRKLFNLWGYHY